MHPLQQPPGISEPQAGCVRGARKVPHVQGAQGRAGNGQGLYPRAHGGHDTLDHEYPADRGVEKGVDG
eukprot:5962682-Heterocapsa_arctica.AAC.1